VASSDSWRTDGRTDRRPMIASTGLCIAWYDDNL